MGLCLYPAPLNVNNILRTLQNRSGSCDSLLKVDGDEEKKNQKEDLWFKSSLTGIIHTWMCRLSLYLSTGACVKGPAGVS